MKVRRFIFLIAFAFPVFALTGLLFADAASEWKAGLLEWRAHREQRLSAPNGWLTLVGLEWLRPGANTVGSSADNRIRLSPGAPAHLGVIEVNGGDIDRKSVV